MSGDRAGAATLPAQQRVAQGAAGGYRVLVRSLRGIAVDTAVAWLGAKAELVLANVRHALKLARSATLC